ncbi:hypothetical protein HYH03_001244 [Edaphochlamys debaryana]|uniref:Uncharacterized protein n=1 Tax=Edaphochlamys debaryana TaxID=47281 RepID=A0A835YGQ8_9CHLO|nr:hypothetical protein HYH03_001244 [Edaphochlamys debaryana]|eukprot:KAG2501464.1 hypothetical protein HYH03_001244 [Edaphochlamys debaryana]
MSARVVTDVVWLDQWGGITDAMIRNISLLRVSRELGMLLRRVHRGVRDMHVLVARMREAGFSEQAPASSQPASTKPSSTKPSSAKPPSAKPPSPKPPSAKPTSAKPPSAKPPSAKPPSAKPPSPKPPSAKPTSAKPTSTTPASTKPSPSPAAAAPAPMHRDLQRLRPLNKLARGILFRPEPDHRQQPGHGWK